MKKEPLNTLRGLDAEIAGRCGRVHEQVMGFDYQSGFYMSRQEFVVCVNPPELPV